MSTQKFTRGPWQVGDNGATIFGPKTDAPSPKTICTLTKEVLVLGTTRANAALISAAPELLESLGAIQEWLSSRNLVTNQNIAEKLGVTVLLDEVNAAIKKAKGG